MSDVFAVVAGDLHLRPKLWMRYPSIRDDTLIAFQDLVEFAVESSASVLVLPGDIFDPPTSQILDFYQRTVEPFPGKILTLQSQHDYADPSWVSVRGILGQDINEELVKIDGTTFYGLEHRSRIRVEAAMDHVPEVDFLVCHQLALPCVPYDNWDLNPEWIPERVSQVLLGDLHQQVGFDLPSGGTGYYTGTMVPTRRDEIDNGHGFLVISSELEVRQVPYKRGRYFGRIKVSTEEGLAELESSDMPGRAICKMVSSEAPQHLELDPAIFVDYNPHLDDVRRQVDRFVDRAEKLGVKCIAEPSISPAPGEEEIKGGQIGVDLLEIVDEEVEDPEVQQLLRELLRDCRTDTIEKFKQEHYEEICP